MLFRALQKQIGAIECQNERAKHDQWHGKYTRIEKVLRHEQYTQSDERLEDGCTRGKRAQLFDMLRLSLFRGAVETLLAFFDDATPLTKLIRGRVAY